MPTKQPAEPIVGEPIPKRLVRTPEEQRAEIERVARERGADLGEDGFSGALGKMELPSKRTTNRDEAEAASAIRRMRARS